MKFGFIAHINNKKEENMLKLLEQVNQLGFFGGGESNISIFSVGVNFVEFTVKSKIGAEARGKLVYLPWYPEDIMGKSEEALQSIQTTALELEEWGADIIGLGGYTACIGRRGKDVQNVLHKAKITTGNVFTATTSVDTLLYILDRLNLVVQGLNVAIVGFPGSISLVIAKMLLKQKAQITMIGRRENVIAKKYFEDDIDNYSNVSFTIDLDKALRTADVVFTATTTGNFIRQELFKPGAIVIDIGEPKDIIGNKNERQDILIVDGGKFGFDEGAEIVNLPINGILRTGFFGCIGETILLTLEQNPDYCSVGRLLDIKKAEEIRQIAKKHGFIVKGLSQFKEAVSDSVIYKIRKEIAPTRVNSESQNIYEKLQTISKEEAMDKYGTYINSVLVAVNKSGNYDRLYVRAEGMHVWDSEGNEFLDFVGGYGSVNIGHNHPMIMENIKKYLSTLLPSILQVAPGYCAAMLAEKLCSILPGDLQKVFFCNSGTEAVEGALKLARVYTGRNKYVSTKNSFHGKSYGALSVTGREKYQAKFKPLLPEVDFIEYNSVEGLEEILKNADVAAMIIEPIQGEGGVIVANDGYLQKCLEICHKYGTLLIVDEVQTGFGRTGKMFAVEHWNIVPDIITCAKSLGGGLVPIGAYVTTKDIWQQAYGNQSNYLLHTSTFGGNSFCTSIGITTLEVIEKEKLYDNAEKMGNYLIAELRKIARKYTFIKEIRGKGLLIGIEFDYTVVEGLASLVDMINSMIPIQIKDQLEALSGNISNSIRHFIDDNIINIENYLDENFASQFSASLLNDEGIISIVTLNNPKVMRLEPPLIITKTEADRFLVSFENVCKSRSRIGGVDVNAKSKNI